MTCTTCCDLYNKLCDLYNMLHDSCYVICTCYSTLVIGLIHHVTTDKWLAKHDKLLVHVTRLMLH